MSSKNRDVAAWETPDPESAAFLSDKPFLRDLLEGNVYEMRQAFEALRKGAPPVDVDTSGLDITEEQISVPNGSVSVRLYKPQKSQKLPALIVYHGGGWALGDLESEHPSCALWAKEFPCVVVNVDYRLAPEHKFPVAVDDCVAALHWTIDNADRLGVNKDKIVLYGNSAGGCLAAYIAQYARDNNIKISGQLLRIPALAHPDALQTESFKTQSKADILSAKSMNTFFEAFLTPETDVKDPRVSPYFGNVNGVAPAYLQIAGLDPLRDGAVEYGDKLKQAGVSTEVQVYPGVPHGFNILPLKVAQQATDDLVEKGRSMFQ